MTRDDGTSCNAARFASPLPHASISNHSDAPAADALVHHGNEGNPLRYDTAHKNANRLPPPPHGYERNPDHARPRPSTAVAAVFLKETRFEDVRMRSSNGTWGNRPSHPHGIRREGRGRSSIFACVADDHGMFSPRFAPPHDIAHNRYFSPHGRDD